MGIRYNKEFVSKDRRILSRGPRDQQRKQNEITTDNSALVNELRSQIKKLQSQLQNTYTTEQVNEEVLKAIKDETINLKEKYNKRINNLTLELRTKDNEIKLLKKQLSELSDNKVTTLLTEANKKIEDMSKRITVGGGHITEVPESDRPKMETIFVDPTEDKAGMEKHIKVKDVSVTKKEQMEDKVGKLKKLMGKLPKKV